MVVGLAPGMTGSGSAQGAAEPATPRGLAHAAAVRQADGMDEQEPAQDRADPEVPMSPFAPPPRRAGLARNPHMLGVLVITVLAFVVVLVVAAVN